MSSNREKLIAGAQKLVEKGQYERALREYLKVIGEDDQDARLWLKVGDLYVKLTKYKEAADAYLRVAQHYSDQGFHLKAVAVYKQIVKIAPEMIDVSVRLADLFTQLGLISDAVAQCQELEAAYRHEGKINEALKTFKQRVELEPDNVGPRVKLAEEYCKEKMTAAAIAEFTRAAEILKGTSRTDDYVKVSERLLFFTPDDAILARDLARIYLDRSDPALALPKLQRCYQAQPDDPDTLDLLATAWELLGQVTNAASVLRELARVAGRKGHREQSLRAYQRIESLLPGDAEAQEALSQGPPADVESPSGSLIGALNLDATVRAIPRRRIPTQRGWLSPGQTFLEEDAEEPTATDRYEEDEIQKLLSEVDIYCKHGLQERALEPLQRVLARSPDHIGARERLALVFLGLGRSDEAVQELWRLYRRAPETPEGERYLVEILRARPDDAEAQACLAARAHPGMDRPGFINPPVNPPAAAPAVPPVGGNPPDDVIELGGESVLDEMDGIEGSITERDNVATASGGPVAAGDALPGSKPDAGQPRGSRLEDELDRADGLVQQGKLDEARGVLDDLAARHPEHPLVITRIRDLVALLARSPEGTPAPEKPQVGRALPVTGIYGEPLPPDGANDSSFSPEDYATHYDLGIAYREMGLLDDAVSEFKSVVADPSREVQCHMMIGLCLVEKKQINDAINQFKKGLYASNIQAQEELALYYEMGHSYEEISDGREALYYYEKVLKRDPRFRDVEARVAHLRSAPAAKTAPPEVDDIDAAFDDLVSEHERK